MRRVLFFASISALFINTSCERCKQCTYSFTETSIVETPSGEEEVKTKRENLLLLDEDGVAYGEECLKYSEYKGNKDGAFTIDDFYEIEKGTSTLEDFDFVCADR